MSRRLVQLIIALTNWILNISPINCSHERTLILDIQRKESCRLSHSFICALESETVTRESRRWRRGRALGLSIRYILFMPPPPVTTSEGGLKGDRIAYRDPNCISNLEEFMNSRNGITTDLPADPSCHSLQDPQFTRSVWIPCLFLACEMCLDTVLLIV